MSIIQKILCAVILLIIMPGLLIADSGTGSISGAGVLINSLIFLIILACFFVAVKVFSFLRGGEMASGWQFLAISFIVLCLGQLLALASSLELFNLDMAIVVAIRLIGVFMLFLGITRIKKALS
jgi:hypothetical protein